MEGVLWILRAGCPWRDLPEEFGPWETVYGCFNRWNADGTMDTVLQRLRAAQINIDAIDERLLDLGITPAIPSKENEDRNARPVEFDRELYRRRNIVERMIGWLKEARQIFSRFEKTTKNFGGMLEMGFTERYLRLAG